MRRMSAAAAMVGAVVLSPFLAGDHSWGSCVASTEGRVNTDSVGEGWGGRVRCRVSGPAQLQAVHAFVHEKFGMFTYSSASLVTSASADMRGLATVMARAHLGTTYGVLNMDDAGRDSGAAIDVAIVVGGSEDVGARWAIFGGEGKEAATTALRAAKRPAFTCGVCGGVDLLWKVTRSESNGGEPMW